MNTFQKQIISVFLLLCLSSSALAQITVTDTVQYLRNKTSNLRNYQLPFLIPNGSEIDTFIQFGQIYPVQDSIQLKGVCFYGYYVSSSPFGANKEVNILIHKTTSIQFAGRTQIIPAIRSEGDTLLKETLTLSSQTDVNNILTEENKKCVSFPILTLKDTFSIVISQDSYSNPADQNNGLFVIGSTSPDGNGEALGVGYYHSQNDQFDQWFNKFSTVASFNYDFIIEPIVEYSVNYENTNSLDAEACKGETADFSLNKSYTIENSELGTNHLFTKDTTSSSIFASQGKEYIFKRDTLFQGISPSSLEITGADAKVIVVDSIVLNGWTTQYTVLTDTLKFDTRETSISDTSFMLSGTTFTGTSTSTYTDSTYWIVNGEATKVVGENFTYEFTTNGNKIIEVIAYGPCTNDTISKTINVNIAGIGLSHQLEFKAYPNPVTFKKLHIEAPNSNLTQYTLKSITGKPIIQGQFSGSTVINLSRVSAGFYLLELHDSDNIGVQRISIQ